MHILQSPICLELSGIDVEVAMSKKIFFRQIDFILYYLDYLFI